MSQLSVANYPLARLQYRTGLDASGNVRHTAGLREFNVLDYGATGDGATNDYAAVAAAMTALYANKGGRLVFPFSSSGYKLGSSVVVDPSSYAGGSGIEIDLCGNHITQTHNGWMFDLLNNYFGANNGNDEAGFKRIDFKGSGAYLIGTGTATGCVRLSDNVRSRVGGYTAKGYTLGIAIRLQVTDIAGDGKGTDRWCEMNTIYDIHSIGTQCLLHLMAGGGLDGLNTNTDRYVDWASFLGCRFRNLVHQGDVDNAVGFDIEGSGNECVWESCGGFVNQDGHTGGKLFNFNGTTPGVFIAPWSDEAGNPSPLSDVVFDTHANITDQWARPVFVGASNICLPHNWRDRITLIGPPRNGNAIFGLNSGGNSPREVLTSNRTWYVNPTTGDDSNSGTNATDATGDGYGPFETIGRALQVIKDSVDAAGFDVIIQLANGTYTTPVTIDFTPTGLNGANFYLRGNTATPGVVVLSATSADALAVVNGTRMQVEGIEFRTTTDGTGLNVDQKSYVSLGSGCRFGACAARHIIVSKQSQLVINDSYTISGDAPQHWKVETQSQLTAFTGTITASNRAFSDNFAGVSDMGYIGVGVTFVNTASTGTRYYADSGGLIQTFGAAITYLPGNAAGSTNAGGQYLSAPAVLPIIAGASAETFAQPAGSISITSYGAQAGGADCLAAFDAAVAAAKSTAAKTVWIPPGVWHWTGGVLNVDGGVKLMGAGYANSTLYADDYTNSTIFLFDDGGAVQQLKLTGAAAPSRQDAWESTKINLRGATNFTIKDNWIQDSPAASISTAGAVDGFGTPCANGYIGYNTIRDSLADSIHMTWRATNMTVEFNDISGSGDDGIACISYDADGTDSCSFITARNNVITNNVDGRCMSVVGGSDVTYTNNYLDGNAAAAGMYFAQEGSYQSKRCLRVKAELNTVKNCGNAAIGHAGIMCFSDGSGTTPSTNDDIWLLRNDIVLTTSTTRNGINYFGPQTNIKFDQNRYTGTGSAQVNGGPTGTTITVNTAYSTGAIGYTQPTT